MSTIKVSKYRARAAPRIRQRVHVRPGPEHDRGVRRERSSDGADKGGADLPLVVDLDGTLIYSDLLWESILLFLKKNFLQAWRLPLWLLQGKVAFKDKLAAAIEFDPATLPYDQALLAEIRAQREQGRATILATGSHRRMADAVATHLQLFDGVHATENARNLTSHDKAEELVGRYGAKGFDYIGNARVDVPVWHHCRVAYSVTRKPFHLGEGRFTERIGSARIRWGRPLLKAMRPRQWLKNMLVFVPMLAGHAINATTFVQSLMAFVAFSLCASSAYLLNDALDAHDDRLHPTKRFRPIANGNLPLPVALGASVLLAAVALALSGAFDVLLLGAVAMYFLATLSYSMYLKRLMMFDIVVLAILYSMRILGGSAATHIEPSFWLLGFSFFVFLSLASLKRHSELINMARAGKEKTRGRGYNVEDRMPIGMMGVNSAMMSVVVLMVYFNSSNVVQLYKTPVLLLGVVPLLVLWLGRLWMLSFRGEVNEDPVYYVSKDPTSLVVAASCVVLAILASI